MKNRESMTEQEYRDAVTQLAAAVRQCFDAARHAAALAGVDEERAEEALFYIARNNWEWPADGGQPRPPRRVPRHALS